MTMHSHAFLRKESKLHSIIVRLFPIIYLTEISNELILDRSLQFGEIMKYIDLSVYFHMKTVINCSIRRMEEFLFADGERRFIQGV